jgi:hypothetical protein
MDEFDRNGSREIGAMEKHDTNQKVNLEPENVAPFFTKGLWIGALFSLLTSYLLGDSLGALNFVKNCSIFSMFLGIVLMGIIMGINGKVIFRDDPKDCSPSSKFILRWLFIINAQFIVGHALGFLLISVIRWII